MTLPALIAPLLKVSLEIRSEQFCLSTSRNHDSLPDLGED